MEPNNVSPENGNESEIPFEFQDADLIEEEEVSTEALSNLALYTLDWSVGSLLERIGGSIDIEPPFQRRDAWMQDRKSKYIESLMLGLPVPQIVLAESKTKKGQFIVLDGKQRLLTMKQFAAPDDKYRELILKKLEFLQQFNGKSLKTIEQSDTDLEYIANFLVQPIRTIVVRNWNDPAVLYRIFVRLNQGSLTLSPQELRQALYPGPFTEWINNRSAESKEILEARRIKRPDFRMRDANMLLRFIAFSESAENYRGNLRKFLDDACTNGAVKWNQFGQDYFENMALRCEKSIKRTFESFDHSSAFYRFNGSTYNTSFSLAVYDLMTSVLGDESITDEEFLSISSDIRPLFEDLCTNNSQFRDSLISTTQSIVSMGGRIQIFGSRISELVGHDLAIMPRVNFLLQNS